MTTSSSMSLNCMPSRPRWVMTEPDTLYLREEKNEKEFGCETVQVEIFLDNARKQGRGVVGSLHLKYGRIFSVFFKIELGCWPK